MFFFFFKQKTAYEMRISDWSSDVCSSDLGLLVNLVSAWLLGGDHHHDHHHTHDHGHHHAHADNNLRSAYFHVLADALTSVLAIAALLAGRYLGWVWMDAAMGFVGAVVIARWSWGLMQNTAARSEEHTSELQSLMRISYAFFCLKKKNNNH